MRASALGYVKNAAAKAMRGDGTNIIGLLLPNITNEFYARFANTMALACEQQSCQLIIHLTNDDIELECKSSERLREVEAKAVVMVPAPVGPRGVNPHLDDMIVIQLIRLRPMAVPSQTILVDDYQAIRNAVVHLAGLGHKSIAYVGADTTLSSGAERLSAYLQGVTDAGLAADESVIRTLSPSFDEGRNSTQEILNQNKASAVVCGGFEISNGALSALMSRGLNPNADFAFVGYGDPSFYSWIDGGLSTINVPVEDLAYRAVTLVEVSKKAEFERTSSVSRFPARLIVRKNLKIQTSVD